MPLIMIGFLAFLLIPVSQRARGYSNGWMQSFLSFRDAIVVATSHGGLDENEQQAFEAAVASVKAAAALAGPGAGPGVPAFGGMEIDVDAGCDFDAMGDIGDGLDGDLDGGMGLAIEALEGGEPVTGEFEGEEGQPLYRGLGVERLQHEATSGAADSECDGEAEGDDEDDALTTQPYACCVSASRALRAAPAADSSVGKSAVPGSAALALTSLLKRLCMC